MEVSSQKFGDEVAVVVSLYCSPRFVGKGDIHVFQRRNENVTQADNLWDVSK